MHIMTANLIKIQKVYDDNLQFYQKSNIVCIMLYTMIIVNVLRMHINK